MQNHKKIKIEEHNCVWSKINRVLKKKKYKDNDILFYQETLGFNVIDNNM